MKDKFYNFMFYTAVVTGTTVISLRVLGLLISLFYI